MTPPGSLRVPVLAGAVVIASTLVPSAQVRFSARVDLVRLDVLVTDRGQPVRGLGPTDFEVRDNGVPQTIEFVSTDQMPVNLLLSMDISESVSGERLTALQAAGRAAVAATRGEDLAGLVAFHHAVLAPVPPTRDRALVGDAVGRLLPGGVGTALHDAVHAGLVLLDDREARPALIVFSDASDTSSWLRSADVLATARRVDAVVYGIVSAGRHRPEFLESIAEATGGRVVRLDRGTRLDEALLAILDEFRSRYVLGYRPTGVPRDGWHPVEVRLKGRRGTVRARPGYVRGGGPGP
jgi:VWFA-related protein